MDAAFMSLERRGSGIHVVGARPGSRSRLSYSVKGDASHYSPVAASQAAA
jgi:hypothetical protein